MRRLLALLLGISLLSGTLSAQPPPPPGPPAGIQQAPAQPAGSPERGLPAGTQTVPAPIEPLPTSPTQASPAQADPTRTNPTQANPTQATPPQATPAQADPARTTPAQTSPTQTNPAQASPLPSTVPSRLPPVTAEQTDALSLEDAINLAILRNVKVDIARERIKEAEANTNQALARLQPSLTLNVSQYDRTTNLRSQGLNFPGFPIPPLIGPYGSFDARVNFVYHLFEPTLIWRYRIGGYNELVREAEEQQAERVAGTLAALDYVECLRADENVLVSEADLLLAQRLQTLAVNQQKAGVAAGLDVTRASVRVSELEAEAAGNRQRARAARRELARLLWLPMDKDLHLTDHLLELEASFLGMDQALANAARDRVEARVAGLQVELSQAEVHAAEAGSSPVVSIYADGGLSGETPVTNGEFTRSFGIALSFPIFDGGLTEAETEAAQSRQRQAEIQQQDTLYQIEKEVRDAFDVMDTARERLAAASQGRDLARKELTMSEHRFEAGITTNLELVQAQTSLTRSEAAYLDALATYNVALVRVAASAGRPDLLLDTYHKALEKP